MTNYIELAQEMGATHAIIVTSKDLVFDPRTYLKCMSCSEFGTWRCPPNQPKYKEAKIMLKKYSEILLIHGHNKYLINKIARYIEKIAFLEDNYFAYALCGCYHCKQCKRSEESPCVNPDYRRPYCYSFGIDTFQTVRNLNLPIQVLKSKDETQNWYAFVLIN
ncbi:MAG: hypothetical protein APF76_01685 [Desulfitibacter sp. BRH_c19]|nr:MAG: hypothetical protein APF76_01685 [Desulfitibacter sp. BRH_c19]